MRESIHPKTYTTKVTCHCGYEFETKSTAGEKIEVEICSHCHPFFTGEHKFIDAAGRIDRFRKKYAKFVREDAK